MKCCKKRTLIWLALSIKKEFRLLMVAFYYFVVVIAYIIIIHINGSSEARRRIMNTLDVRVTKQMVI